MTQASHPHLSTGAAGMEQHGIDYIPPAERKSSPRNVFSIFIGANLTFGLIVLGWLPISFGLSWWAAFWSIIAGCAVGAVVIIPIALMGPRTGTNGPVSSGAIFGVVGRIIGVCAGPVHRHRLLRAGRLDRRPGGGVRGAQAVRLVDRRLPAGHQLRDHRGHLDRRRDLGPRQAGHRGEAAHPDRRHRDGDRVLRLRRQVQRPPRGRRLLAGRLLGHLGAGGHRVRCGDLRVRALRQRLDPPHRPEEEHRPQPGPRHRRRRVPGPGLPADLRCVHGGRVQQRQARLRQRPGRGSPRHSWSRW